MAIDVTRDMEGLRQALSEMLERGYAQSRVSRSLDSADENGGERIFGSLPGITLSPGYYKRAEYLLWLEKCKSTGLLDQMGGLTMPEADGLMAVAEARAEFERNHPPCGVCGARQESPFATSCCKCNTEFVRRVA
ncbi:MAG: hypothetical protein ACLQG3_14690 [Terracidiphilus sp.]